MKSLFVDGATKRECGGRWPAVHCRALWSLAIVLGSVVGSVQGYAAEEPERFLSKLRELGYFDTASEYLDFIAKSDLVDDAFKQTIPFEQAVTLKDRAARSGDVVKKQALLEQAIKAFGAFAAQHPDSTRSADVHLEVANVYSLLAQLTMTSVKRPNADRKKLEAEATDYYTKAISESKQAEAMLLSQRRKVKDELVELRKTVGNPNDPGRKVSKKEKDLIQLRSDLGFDWMLAKYRQVLILDQQSLVFVKGSDQWKQVVEKAAKAYEEFFFKFDRFTVGFIARVGQMRCLAAVGRFDEALDCLPDVTDFEESTLAHERKIWFNSFVIELECLIGKGEFKRAVDLSETKLKKSEVNTPQAKTILYLRAKAALALIDQLGPDKTKDKKKLREKAKRALETLVKTKSAYQAEAAEKLSSLGIEAKQPQEDAGAPATFDTAFRRGAAAMQQWGQLGKQAK
ncbi:MAG: hypothetical protein P8K78_04945, partial [Pirellulales bacterium]|nr:hypothetical protein [Pirellulales bacterium]